MRFAPAVFALLLAALSASAAFSRQDDERLNELFVQLQSTADGTAAVTIQGMIWQLWTQSGSDTVDLLMTRTGRAMSQGDYRAALQHVDAVIELDPDFAEGWNRRATIYYLLGEFTASVVDIERPLVLEPRHFGALSGLGMIYAAI